MSRVAELRPPVGRWREQVYAKVGRNKKRRKSKEKEDEREGVARERRAGEVGGRSWSAPLATRARTSRLQLDSPLSSST